MNEFPSKFMEVAPWYANFFFIAAAINLSFPWVLNSKNSKPSGAVDVIVRFAAVVGLWHFIWLPFNKIVVDPLQPSYYNCGGLQFWKQCESRMRPVVQLAAALFIGLLSILATRAVGLDLESMVKKTRGYARDVAPDSIKQAVAA